MEFDFAIAVDQALDPSVSEKAHPARICLTIMALAPTPIEWVLLVCSTSRSLGDIHGSAMLAEIIRGPCRLPGTVQ